MAWHGQAWVLSLRDYDTSGGLTGLAGGVFSRWFCVHFRRLFSSELASFYLLDLRRFDLVFMRATSALDRL
jgi:hypothetical protein